MASKLLCEQNVGGLDLSLRAFVGTVALILLAMDLVPQNLELITALIAFVGVWTSITRHCTPYSILGINTAK